MPRVALEPTPRGRSARIAQTGRRPVYFGGFRDTPVYDRACLGAGVTLPGPAIVEERESTLVIPPRAHLTINRSGNALVTLT
jgi:N-methylhydantoinase A/oxoprolinase/acetone carboxylase beta subunit